LGIAASASNVFLGEKDSGESVVVDSVDGVTVLSISSALDDGSLICPLLKRKGSVPYLVFFLANALRLAFAGVE
jgi:hypothetical protein